MRRVTSIMRSALFASLAAGSAAVFAQTPQDPVVIDPAPPAATMDPAPPSAAAPDPVVVERYDVAPPTSQSAPNSAPQDSGWRHAPDVGG